MKLYIILCNNTNHDLLLNNSPEYFILTTGLHQYLYKCHGENGTAFYHKF